MIKTYFILAMLSLGATGFVQAQQKVALQSNGTTTVFGGANPFTDAYNAAVNGDTLYLPGGNLPFPANINKGVVIIGAGHYPDSTEATGKTVLAGNISISQDADNLWLEGIQVTGTITFTSNHKVDNVTIRRCNIGSLSYPGTGVTPSTNNSIRENIFLGVTTFNNLTSSTLSNNIFNNQIVNAVNVGISNNILLHNPSSVGSAAIPFYNVKSCFISNNVIFRSFGGPSGLYYLTELNTFANNVLSVRLFNSRLTSMS